MQNNDQAAEPPIPAPSSTRRQPIKAYENLDFIHSAYGRHVRVLSEFIEPQHRLGRHHIRNTIVFFGSARLLSAEKAQANLQTAEDIARRLPAANAAKLIEKARRALENSAYYEAARRLASELTLWSKGLPKGTPPYHICSGGGPGIMEAANRGASEAGGVTLGLGISLPYEQTNNAYITEGLSFEFHYFFIRKYWFIYLAKAMIAFPGGFGTMDELFELLTLLQTRKMRKSVPILLYGAKFWNEILNFDVFRKWGLIDDEDIGLFRIVDSVEEARDHIIQSLTELHLQNTSPDPKP
ncbi:MAG: LOG family protein [Puniceicoccales bacterium]|jgi:uncharacterized protein (TIGR00730 family)|nr:LOG family protein [Puniceicoccales bacterium]